MSERMQAWVATTLGALCACQANAAHIPDEVFLLAAAVWSGLGLLKAFELLRRAL
jgi:hypothetical protein